MLKEFFLEIMCEELPPSHIDLALQQLSTQFEKTLQSTELEYEGAIHTYGTPRRLIVHIPQLAEQQKDRVNQVKGPPVKIAFNDDGSPTRAGLGFASKLGVSLNDVQTMDTDRGPYLVYHRVTVGVPTRELLPTAIPGIIKAISFPRSMKWASHGLQFSRPIRQIFAVYGGEVLPITMDGIASADTTYGHARLHGQRLEVYTFHDYRLKLRERWVLIDTQERQELIEQLLDEKARAMDGKLIPDPGLLKTVARCTEYPSVITGSFDKRYLSLPREVLITSMRTHQKFFSVQDCSGFLLPAFLHITDNPLAVEETVRQGNEKVLKARLADAEFFFNEDRKRTMESRVPLTDGIIFHQQLGSLLHKSKRVKYLSITTAKHLFTPVPGEVMDTIHRAATLYKADLTTHMVGEFPELQGSMGAVYLKLEGEPNAVAEAVFEHYLPRWADDTLPHTMAGIILAIADKIDTIAGYFKIGLVPSGSEDPFALRRQTAGICQILLFHQLNVNLVALFKHALELYEAKLAEQETVLQAVKYFFSRRLETIFNKEHSYDTIKACLDGTWFNPVDLQARLTALTAFRSHEDFEDLMVGFRRAARIIPDEQLPPLSPELLLDDSEKNLYHALTAQSENIKRNMDEKNYDQVLTAFVALKKPIDAFFDGVLVMCEDSNMRYNRLALLSRIVSLFNSFADFTKIVISQDRE